MARALLESIYVDWVENVVVLDMEDALKIAQDTNVEEVSCCVRAITIIELYVDMIWSLPEVAARHAGRWRRY